MRIRNLVVFIFYLLFSGNVFAQNVPVVVKGISNEQFDGLQKDREEAIVEAKRQACEKAGLNLSSVTRVENFEIKQDLIETKANAVLLPGFEIVDIGYLQSGQYVVVLAGEVVSAKEKSAKAKLRFFIRHNDLTFLGKKQGALKAFYKEIKQFQVKVFNGKLIEEYEKDLVRIYKKKNSFYTLVFEYKIPEGPYEYFHTNYINGDQFIKQNVYLKSGQKYLIKNLKIKNSFVLKDNFNNAGFGPILTEQTHEYKREFGKFPNEYELIFSKSDKSIVNKN